MLKGPARSHILRLFVLGLMFRLALELTNGKYPVGYDTNTYYVIAYVKGNVHEQLGFSILYYAILVGLGKVIGDVLIAIKLIACILSALLMISLYLWGLFCGLSESDAYEYAKYAYFYFLILRMMWDLHRNVLGLILLLTTTYMISRRRRLAIVFSILTGLAHPLVYPALALLLLPNVFRRDRLAISSLAAGLVSWSVTVLSAVRIFAGTDVMQLTSLKRGWAYMSLPIVVAYVIWADFPLLIPLILIVIAQKQKITELRNVLKELRRREIIPALLWFLVFTLAAFCFWLGYRLIFISAVPGSVLSFYLVTHSRELKRRAVRVNYLICILYPMLSWLLLFELHPALRRTIPPVPAGGSLPPWDLYAAEDLMRRAKEILQSGGASYGLLLPHPLISAAYEAGIDLTSSNVVIAPADVSDLTPYLLQMLHRHTAVLLVWYKSVVFAGTVPPPPTPASIACEILAERGGLALFLYSHTA